MIGVSPAVKTDAPSAQLQSAGLRNGAVVCFCVDGIEILTSYLKPKSLSRPDVRLVCKSRLELRLRSSFRLSARHFQVSSPVSPPTTNQRHKKWDSRQKNRRDL